MTVAPNDADGKSSFVVRHRIDNVASGEENPEFHVQEGSQNTRTLVSLSHFGPCSGLS